jgi:hypothetical protein
MFIGSQSLCKALEVVIFLPKPTKMNDFGAAEMLLNEILKADESARSICCFNA